MFEEWSLNFESSTPCYLQIYNYIKRCIFSGQLTIGTKLPTQKELAAQFGVNRSTVVSAIELLVADDLIKSNGKAGTFVKHNASSLNAPPPPNWIDYIHAGSHYPNKSTAQMINNNEHRSDIYALTRPELSKELFLPDMLEAMQSHHVLEPDMLGYEHPKGNFLLRENLCKYYGDLGVRVNPDQILIVSGALQALYLIAAGILFKGSTILTEEQSYAYSVNVFQSAGMRLFGIPADEEGMRLNHLDKSHLQTKASILYSIPNFNNPTGTLMREEQKKELYQLCQRKKLPVIEDDTYRELYFTEDKPAPLRAYDTNALSQNLMNFLFEHGYYTQHLDYIRGCLKQRRDFVLDILQRNFRGLCHWHAPKGGVYIWLHVNPKISVSKLFQRCLKNKVLFCPGYIYSNHANNCIRVSYSYLAPEDLECSLLLLKKCMLEELN